MAGIFRLRRSLLIRKVEEIAGHSEWIQLEMLMMLEWPQNVLTNVVRIYLYLQS